MSTKPGILRETHLKALARCYRISSCGFTEQFITYWQLQELPKTLPYRRESLASKKALAQVLDVNQSFLDDPCSWKATNHILKPDCLFCGRWSHYVQTVKFGQQYWTRKKKFKESAKVCIWQILISRPASPKLCLALTAFRISRKQYSLLCK